MIRPVAARGAAADGPDRESRCRLALPREARRLGHGPSAVRPSSPGRPAGLGGLARRGATSHCAAGWPLFLANIRSAQSCALSSGFARAAGCSYSSTAGAVAGLVGVLFPRPCARRSRFGPFRASPHGARVCGGFDCFLGRLFWRCSFSPFGRASGFFFAWLRSSFCSFRAAAFTLIFSA